MSPIDVKMLLENAKNKQLECVGPFNKPAISAYYSEQWASNPGHVFDPHFFAKPPMFRSRTGAPSITQKIDKLDITKEWA